MEKPKFGKEPESDGFPKELPTISFIQKMTGIAYTEAVMVRCMIADVISALKQEIEAHRKEAAREAFEYFFEHPDPLSEKGRKIFLDYWQSRQKKG